MLKHQNGAWFESVLENLFLGPEDKTTNIQALKTLRRTYNYFILDIDQILLF